MSNLTKFKDHFYIQDMMADPILSSEDGRFRVIHSQPEMVEQLAAIQQVSFPSLAEAELILAKHYQAHLDVFPQGQLALINERDEVIGCSTDFRTKEGSFWSFKNIEHKYIDAVVDNWLSNHDPEGEWMYGADIGILPEYRGKKLGQLLYQARHQQIQTINLKGHVGGGMPKGFYRYKDEMSIEIYVEKVLEKELFDPALSIQFKCDFKPFGVIHNYLEDPSCDNNGILVAWHNPAYEGGV